MRGLIPIALAILVLLSPPAVAAEDRKADVGQYVDLSPVGLPITANGRLINYVFVSVRIVLTSSAHASHWREREPFFRDALVRAAHRSPFNKAGDYQAVDTAKLTAALIRDGGAITGPGVIRSVVVTSQAPQRRISPPRPAA